MTLVGGGIVCGAAASLVLVRALRPMLFGIHPADPATFAAVALAVAAVALAACWIPARRATRYDPAVTLRAG
jgi:putative ABC transport system permease protein